MNVVKQYSVAEMFLIAPPEAEHEGQRVQT